MRVRQRVTRVLLHRLYSCVQLLYCILTVSTINVHLFTSPLVGVHRIATGVFVCLYVCPLAYLKNKMPKLRQIFYACRLWSGLIWRQYTYSRLCFPVLWVTLCLHLMARRRGKICCLRLPYFFKNSATCAIGWYDTYTIYSRIRLRNTTRGFPGFGCVYALLIWPIQLIIRERKQLGAYVGNLGELKSIYFTKGNHMELGFICVSFPPPFFVLIVLMIL